MPGWILAIDQGTSSSRSVMFDAELLPRSSAQQEFEQIYPQPGWVEHDPEEIWRTVTSTVAGALKESSAAATDIVGVGITNQRETTVVWDRQTGACVYNAIVWQDRRTAELCRKLRDAGHEATITDKTGLRLDPYFSATKLAWILDNVDGARARAKAGQLAFGTIDTYLVWRLTAGRSHFTDATNASRTLLFNIHTQEWDAELLALFDIPAELLPEVRDCCDAYGRTQEDVVGFAAPILGVAGDQQAALVGQAGFDEGVTKSTYGTGLFTLANTGGTALQSRNQLLTTIAMRLDGSVSYGLEGSVFVAGSAMQWLRDELAIISSASESEDIARQTGIVEDVVVVPAFAGLGAPYWDADARGAILGLTRGSDRHDIVTATLQSIAYQTHDLINAMTEDGLRPSVIRVDGGMVANNWLLQFLADILALPIERPANVESTVLGAASLAALGAGLLDAVADVAGNWSLDRRFEPAMPAAQRERLLQGWRAAVGRTGTKS